MVRQAQMIFWPALLALLLTLASGWSGLKGISFALFCLGIVGALPMILIEGVHGGGSHEQNMIGGAVFVIVNFIFYFFVFRWALARFIRESGRHGDGDDTQSPK
jgi:hypothetical protein